MSVFAVYVKVIEIDLRGVGFGRSLEGPASSIGTVNGQSIRLLRLIITVNGLAVLPKLNDV